MTRGPRCFRCLIFTLSGPVELLFLVSFGLYCLVVGDEDGFAV